jgi:DNA polymerase I-like protein with 3'-5' exonuclease and polymerase domains
MQKRFKNVEQNWLNRIAEICRVAGEFSFDIETFPAKGFEKDSKAGLDPYKSEIRSFQISTREYSWFIDLLKVKDVTPILELLNDYRIVTVIHNALFEQSHIQHKYGKNVVIENVFCTMLASRLLASKGPFAGGVYGHSLKDALERHCQIAIDKTEQRSNWSGELTESQIEYALKDSEILFPLYDVLRHKIDNVGMNLTARIEFDAVLAFSDLSLDGIPCDIGIRNQIGDHLQNRISLLYDYLAEQLPSRTMGFFYKEAIKLSSPDELFAAFYKVTGIKLHAEKEDEDEEDKISTAAAILLKYIKQYPKLVDALIDFNSLNHNYDTFVKKFDRFIHPVTGNLQPDYFQIGQLTGRPTAFRPNVYQEPRPSTIGNKVKVANLVENYYCPVSYRHSFYAPEGYKYVKVDFASNQFRILADFCRDEILVKEFNAPNANPYKRIAALFLGIPIEEVTDEQRQNAKTLVLAFCFGAGAAKHQKTTLLQTRNEISLKKAKEDRDMFHSTLKGLSRWIKAQPDLALTRMYTEATSGRKIFFPRDNPPTYNESINFPIATTESDQAKLAAGRIAREIRKGQWNVQLRLFVYDDLSATAKETQAVEWGEIHSKIMSDSAQEFLKVIPAVAEVDIYDTWGGPRPKGVQ